MGICKRCCDKCGIEGEDETCDRCLEPPVTDWDEEPQAWLTDKGYVDWFKAHPSFAAANPALATVVLVFAIAGPMGLTFRLLTAFLALSTISSVIFTYIRLSKLDRRHGDG